MPHDRFYGIAAVEIAEHRADRDLLARAYALAVGDAEKTKAIYILIRAERLEQEDLEFVIREAQLKKEAAEREKRLVKKPLPQKINLPSKELEKSQPHPVEFSDPEMAKAVKAMRDALAASKFKDA